MSKTITSQVSRFPGTVILSDPLTFPQLIAYEDGMAKVREATRNIERLSLAATAVCTCIEKWNIPGLEAVTPETFPATPIRAIDSLIAWLIKEITQLIHEADNPNA